MSNDAIDWLQLAVVRTGSADAVYIPLATAGHGIVNKNKPGVAHFVFGRPETNF